MFPAWFFWKLHVAVTRATVFLRLRGRPKFNVPSIFEGGHILTKFRVNCRRMCATFTTKFDLYQISEIRHRVILAWKSRWINWFFCYCRPNDAANPVLRMCKALTLIGTGGDRRLLSGNRDLDNNFGASGFPINRKA
jgi:hypothetical protein